MLPVRLRVMWLPPCSEIGDDASGFACSFASAAARSSAWTTVLGASSSLISQPIGGDGGGEMKKRRSDLGSARCWSVGFIGVFTPKYTRMRKPMSCSPSRACRTCIAESMSKKETTMRRKDLSGAHVCTLACWLIVSRISVRVDRWKISGAKRF